MAELLPVCGSEICESFVASGQFSLDARRAENVRRVQRLRRAPRQHAVRTCFLKKLKTAFDI